MSIRKYDKVIYFFMCETQELPDTEETHADIYEFCHANEEFDDKEDALKQGWTIEAEKCYCPYCSKKRNK